MTNSDPSKSWYDPCILYPPNAPRMKLSDYQRPHSTGYLLTNADWRTRVLHARLHISDTAEAFPFQALYTAYAGDKVFVFLVVNNQPVTLEDAAGMYPSDTLITQLRLLM